MGEHLTGSVGIVQPNCPWRQGAPPPGNSTDNQQVVIGLLSKIPAAQGGMQEEWGTPPLPGPDGMCPQVLGDAIYAFQSFWKANGTFKNIDGVVDPGGNTLRVMNSCVVGSKITSGGPNGLLPSNAPNLNKIIQRIRAAFPKGSSWSLDNAPGISAGFVVGGSVGQLDFKNDDGTMRYASYGAAALTLGLDTGGTPVTFTASTRDMWSATSVPALSGMGRIYGRPGQSLSFEDMLGPMAIVGMTGCLSDKFSSDLYQASGIGKDMVQGMSFTIFMLGVPPDQMMAMANPNVVFRLPDVSSGCRAVCMSAGQCVGIDLSIGVSYGYAVRDVKRDFFNQIKQTNAADPYIKKAEDTLTKAGENMLDAAYNKLKDWSPL
jgi:hypothetical protein